MDQRITFFATSLKDERWIKNMTGKEEYKVQEILEDLGYVLKEDFLNQFPLDEKYVLDFAFAFERIAIEVDGKSHRYGQVAINDREKDEYLNSIDWVIIRIPEDRLEKNPSFFRHLIREVVEEKRKEIIK